MNEPLLQSLVQDYKNGNSLRSLSSKYNLPMGTIHYNLSKLKIIRKQHIIKSLINKDEFLVGIFVGFWCGDGSRFLYSKGRTKRYTIKLYFDKRNKTLIRLVSRINLILFGKSPYPCNGEGNKFSLRLCSIFVYTFLNDYINHCQNKTLTIQLKKDISEYSSEFLKGFLIGLTLSDGCIKLRFCYTSISSDLINNLSKILVLFNYIPHIRSYKRPNRFREYQLYLTKKDSILLINFMDDEFAKHNLNIRLRDLKLT